MERECIPAECCGNAVGRIRGFAVGPRMSHNDEQCDPAGDEKSVDDDLFSVTPILRSLHEVTKNDGYVPLRRTLCVCRSAFRVLLFFSSKEMKRTKL